jgi:copper homeostasis protein
MSNVVLEACVDSVEQAIRAERSGAHRLELCANLHLDGTTPDKETIEAVIGAVNIPVKVMIRPRGGDFVYREEEFNQMLESIRMCKELGVPEIATGVLDGQKALDLKCIEALANAASPMGVTIHKCIDLVPDLFIAIDKLKNIPGVHAILSSGQSVDAISGAERLRQMLLACGARLTLIVAGKVTQENLEFLIREIGATEFHGRKIV